MAGKKLDRKKSYGTVNGEHGAYFEQDGVMFDASGDELIEAETKQAAKPAAVAKEPKVVKEPKAAKGKEVTGEPQPPAAPSAIDAQIAAQAGA